MEQTAMQQLVNKVSTVINEYDDVDRPDFINGYKHALKCLVSDIELQMMAIEKEQIEQAHMAGQANSQQPFDASASDASAYYKYNFKV